MDCERAGIGSAVRVSFRNRSAKGGGIETVNLPKSFIDLETSLGICTLWTQMRVDKWYLDAVLNDGSVWYGYQARLQLRGMPAIHWTAGTRVIPEGLAQTTSRWKAGNAPKSSAGSWHWFGPDGFKAAWEPASGGFEYSLASEAEFKVHWNCVVPMARVLAEAHDKVSKESHGKRIGGLGYVEHLSLETAKASLPFRRLWWGRAHAGDSSLVWIRWGAGRDLTLIVENGHKVPGQLKSFNGGVRVETASGRWETCGAKSLCDRDVRDSFPGFLVWMVRGAVPTRERKMTGPVRLRSSGTDFMGSGIWEEVQWL